MNVAAMHINGFTNHSLERLNERHISLQMADYVCQNGAVKSSYGDCFVIQGKVPEKQNVELRLVLNNLGDLVTACWTRAKKSLKSVY